MGVAQPCKTNRKDFPEALKNAKLKIIKIIYMHINKEWKPSVITLGT